MAKLIYDSHKSRDGNKTEARLFASSITVSSNVHSSLNDKYNCDSSHFQSFISSRFKRTIVKNTFFPDHVKLAPLQNIP